MVMIKGARIVIIIYSCRCRSAYAIDNAPTYAGGALDCKRIYEKNVMEQSVYTGTSYYSLVLLPFHYLQASQFYQALLALQDPQDFLGGPRYSLLDPPGCLAHQDHQRLPTKRDVHVVISIRTQLYCITCLCC